MHILSFGEILWDIIEGHEFLGGAPLNFSVSAQRLGNTAHLISSVGNDRLGLCALERMKDLCLDTSLIRTLQEAPTGVAIAKKYPNGDCKFEIPRPAAFDSLHVEPSQLRQLCELDPEWIYFGTLAQTCAENETLLSEILLRLPKARRFYDINLRHGHWNLPLVQRLSSLATIIKLNEEEAELLFAAKVGDQPFSIESFCRHWSVHHGPRFVCVTRGKWGCSIWREDELKDFEGYPVSVTDTVGAGDAFSAALLHGIQMSWPMDQTAAFANAAGAIVASRASATPDWSLEECLTMIARGK